MSRKNALTPFEQALVDAALDEFTDIPENEADIDLALSPEFQIRAKKLCINSERKLWHYANTTLKKAIIVAVIAALLTTSVIAAPAIIRYFVRNKITHYEFSFDHAQIADAPEIIKQIYYPTYIPADYEYTGEFITVGLAHYTWEIDRENRIVFDQYPVWDRPENSDSLKINAENTTTRYIEKGSFQVLEITHEEYLMLVWTDYQYLYTLTFHGVLPSEEIDKVFFSIEEDPNAVVPESE